MRKDCQNVLDVGQLVIQRLCEEVTGKVQKYARMSARDLYPTAMVIDNGHRKHQTSLYQLVMWPVTF